MKEDTKLELDALRARELRSKLSLEESIVAHLEGENVFLSEEDERIRDRWLLAWQLWIDDEKTYSELVSTIASTFDISERQAARDLKAAQTILPDIRKTAKSATRHLLAARLDKAYQFALKDKDSAAMADIVWKIVKLNGLDKDAVEFDFDKMKAHAYVLLLDEATRTTIDKLQSAPGTIDLSNLMDKMFDGEEVTFEEVK